MIVLLKCVCSVWLIEIRPLPPWASLHCFTFGAADHIICHVLQSRCFLHILLTSYQFALFLPSLWVASFWKYHWLQHCNVLASVSSQTPFSNISLSFSVCEPRGDSSASPVAYYSATAEPEASLSSLPVRSNVLTWESILAQLAWSAMAECQRKPSQSQNTRLFNRYRRILNPQTGSGSVCHCAAII